MFFHLVRRRSGPLFKHFLATFCLEASSMLSFQSQMHNKQCPVCLKKFKSRNSNAVCCSRLCKTRLWRGTHGQPWKVPSLNQILAREERKLIAEMMRQ